MNATTHNIREKLTYEQKAEILDQWHAESMDDPEYLWLTQSFEDMAGAVLKAHWLATEPRDDTPDNGWMARQDAVAGATA